ncbi:hypothetical protein B566_EDAN006925 [Ephemera danica]|nr:hypothetical protein B566_EDAN006925 [Ephemera danica]
MAFAACIPARLVLWVLVFSGFAINYMVRININIAIVSMVIERSSGSSNEVAIAECATKNNLTLEVKNITLLPVNITKQITNGSKTFDWNEQEQNLVLGAFFWTMWITQLPGGILAQRYGSKRVFGLTQLLSVILNFLVPYSVTWGYQGLVVIRLLQGFFNGFTWPSMNPLISQWVPPAERSKFMSAYLGSSLGAAVTFPLYAMLMSWYGWEAVFYFTGVAGTVWFLGWWLLVFDTPRKHPRISERELEYIERKLGTSVHTKTKLSTPWCAILTSGPVWLCTLAQFGAMWGLFTLLIQAPTYFKFIHGFGIQMTGLLSGIPHLSRTVFSLLYSVLADCLLQQKILETTAVRKFATFVGVMLAGGCMLGLAFMGCNSTGAIVLLTISTALNGAISSGALAATVDLSPNYSGVVFGIVGMVSVFPGFISPAVVGYLTNKNQSSSQWRLVFLIGAGIQLVTSFLFIAFGSSETQKWNTPASSDDVSEKTRNKTRFTVTAVK